jgi:hypothetical protein
MIRQEYRQGEMVQDRKRGHLMAIAKKDLRGSIQGRTVLLQEDPGLPDGQEVVVTLMLQPPSDEAARERLRRCAGGWAEDAVELDEYLEWNRQQRKINRPEIGE